MSRKENINSSYMLQFSTGILTIWSFKFFKLISHTHTRTLKRSKQIPNVYKREGIECSS